MLRGSARVDIGDNRGGEGGGREGGQGGDGDGRRADQEHFVGPIRLTHRMRRRRW